MPAWTDYTSKTTPADTDEVMIKDFSDSNKANKRMLLSGLWNWIVNKLTNAVIANLETSPQTIVGAINSLNSNIQNKFYHSSGTSVYDYVNNEKNRNYITFLNGWALSDVSVLPTKAAAMYRIYDYHDYSWGHRQIWETCGIEHAIFARNYNDGWSDFELYTANGKLSSLTTTAKDNLVSAVNEVKYKIEIIQGIKVDTEGDLVTPIKIGKSIPFMFESTDRLGWKHIFIKNVNKSSDYWILNSYGTTGPVTGSISGKIYYFQV